jgi:hypothetical protein
MPAAVQIAVLGRTSKSKSLCLGNKNGKLVKSLRGLLRFHFAGAVKRGSTERRCLAEIVWQWCFSLAEDERESRARAQKNEKDRAGSSILISRGTASSTAAGAATGWWRVIEGSASSAVATERSL